MKRKSFAVIIASVALFVSSGSQALASVMTFHVVSRGNISESYMALTERVITAQVNGEVSRHWHVPRIVFGPSGIPVTFAPRATIAQKCGPGAAACHLNDGEPSIWISNDWWDFETQALDHEIIETAVDPNPHPGTGVTAATTLFGYLAEPVDPVIGTWYVVDRVALSDFVYPRWYEKGATGAMDYMNVLSGHPLDFEYGSPALCVVPGMPSASSPITIA